MIILSAIPIALIVNIIRITVTGLLYVAVGPENEYVKHLGHDWAGYFMMPLALGFLWIELQVPGTLDDSRRCSAIQAGRRSGHGHSGSLTSRSRDVE